MKTLFVLDAVNFLFRSYYAIPSMTNPKGESTGGLYGFIRSVFKIIKEHEPEHLVAVFDGPDNARSRKVIYEKYKAHRAGMPDDLVPQLEWALEFCEMAGIPFLSVPGVEADDVIGSIAHWSGAKGVKTFLCSSDKDLCQLVNKNVVLLNPAKNDLLIDRAKVKEIHNVYPEQIVDLLSLMGDKSDGIPGLPRIGPKTAGELLNTYGTMEEIFAHTDELKGKKKETFEEGEEMAMMSRKLATIYTDVPFPKKEEFFCLKQPDTEKVREFYHEMRFMTLLKELEPAELPLEFDEGDKAYTLVDSESRIEALVEKLKRAKELCIDTETTSLSVVDAKLVGIGITDAPKRGWYVPLNGAVEPDTVLTLLKPLLESKNISFFGHNIKYDLHILLRAGIEVSNVGFDTMIASSLLAPQKQRHGLDSLCLELFNKKKTPISSFIGRGKTMEDAPLEKVGDYCCEDVDYTFRLKNVFEPKIKKEGLEEILQRIELPLLFVLLDMEDKGIFLDRAKLRTLSTFLQKEIEGVSKEIFELAGKHFNLNSPKQLGPVLFEKLEIRPAKKTKTGYSTSADILESLKDSHPIIPLILQYRGLEKLRSTYADALPDQISPTTQRVHCTFNQSVTATGRLSCQDPNLQNIPVRSKEGKKIRDAFRPEQKGWSYLSSDYSQIELRLLAHLSEDPALIKAFRAGEDIHAFTASLVYDVPVKEVTPKMRYAAKAVNFGILYGQSAFGLSKELGIPKSEAAAFIETYFDRYKKVASYLDLCKQTVKKKGYSITLFGRKRPIPEIDNKNAFIRQAAERLAVNTPLQGSAADLIKLAMIEIHREIEGMDTQMILQIHDELIFEAPDRELPTLKKIVKKHMEGVIQLKVPLVVDIEVGKNWGEC